MLGSARTDADLGAALGERWLAPRRAWGRVRMAQTERPGDLRAGTDPEAALGILYGPLYAPLLFGGTVPGLPAVRAHLGIACRGFCT